MSPKPNFKICFKVCEDCPCPEIVEANGRCFDCVGEGNDLLDRGNRKPDDYNYNWED